MYISAYVKIWTQLSSSKNPVISKLSTSGDLEIMLGKGNFLT
jgi:hypothetical protein